jgi:hypothetical protein
MYIKKRKKKKRKKKKKEKRKKKGKKERNKKTRNEITKSYIVNLIFNAFVEIDPFSLTWNRNTFIIPRSNNQ